MFGLKTVKTISRQEIQSAINGGARSFPRLIKKERGWVPFFLFIG
jgi:hypothetical protein